MKKHWSARPLYVVVCSICKSVSLPTSTSNRLQSSAAITNQNQPISAQDNRKNHQRNERCARRNDRKWRLTRRKSTRIKKGRAWYKITTKTSWRRQEVMTEVAHARYPPYTPTSDNVPPNAPKQQVRLFGGWSGHQIQQYKRTYGHSQQANNSGGLQKSS